MNNILKTLLFSASALSMTACSNGYMAYQNSQAGRTQANRGAYNQRALETHIRTTPNNQALVQFSNNGCSGTEVKNDKPLLKPEVKNVKYKKPRAYRSGNSGWHLGPFGR
jgi:hypothetical protein